jgi:GWxTD domain-containing protein
MSWLEIWVHTPRAAALGWTLAHSLWEGALVALVLAGALGLLGSSRTRYAAACLAMLAMLGGFGVTFQHVLAEQRIQGGFGQRLAIGAAPSDLGDGTIVGRAPAQFRAVECLPWLAPFWMAGVMFFQLRCLASWLAARRFRRRGVCAATSYWQGRIHRLAAQVRVSRPVTLLESCLAEMPVVVGYVRPVILMPVGLMTGLPVSQIESILLHEMAHIRRHDYLVNLLQTVVEGLVFYHPAVWWISGVIRAERENCCDDLVVATQGDALAYAAALTALEDHRGTVREAVLAATGGSIVTRVRRLLVPAEGPRAALTPVLSAAVLTVAVAAAMAAWQTSAPPRPPAPPVPPAPPAVPAPPGRPARARPSAAKPYAKWVSEDVVYIITNDERAAFRRLQSDEEREHFIEQFWLRRDPTPDTPENEFKEEHYRRIAYANENFASSVPGWKTDRGRIYITYGPPDEKESHSSSTGANSFSTSEQWRYHYIEDVGTNIVVEFVRAPGTGEYRMSADPAAVEMLHAPGEAPVTNADTPRAGATVRMMGQGKVLISVPLTAYGDHRVKVYGRVAGKEGHVQIFGDSIWGPAPLYTHEMPLAKGSYKFDIVVKDVATGKLAADTIEFEVK